MEWKCAKCGQVVTSPPLNNDCPKGGSHSWANAKYTDVINKKNMNSLQPV